MTAAVKSNGEEYTAGGKRVSEAQCKIQRKKGHDHKIQNLPKVFFIISFLLMLACYIITPFINEAKDTNNEMLWSTLHLLTIFFTLITLVLNFLTIIYWKFESKSI